MDGYFGCIFGCNRSHYACKIKGKRDKEGEEERQQQPLTMSMVTSRFFLVTWAWEKM